MLRHSDRDKSDICLEMREIEFMAENGVGPEDTRFIRRNSRIPDTGNPFFLFFFFSFFPANAVRDGDRFDKLHNPSIPSRTRGQTRDWPARYHTSSVSSSW